jgi:hypothetical protein
MNKTKTIISILIFCVLISSAFAYNDAHKKSCKTEFFDCIKTDYEGNCFNLHCIEEDYLKSYAELYSGNKGIDGENGSSGNSGFSKLIKYFKNDLLPSLKNIFITRKEIRIDTDYIYNRLDYLNKKIDQSCSVNP